MSRYCPRQAAYTWRTKKHADYILYYKSNAPVAVIQGKDNSNNVRAGM